MADGAVVPGWLAGERRPATFESMLGATGGLVALAGVFALFSEVPEGEVRAAGLGLALLTLVVGCVLTAARRSPALDAAGVVLAAGAVAPLVVLALNDPERLDSEGDLLAAALLAVLVWLVLFFVGPARGHGLFLGLSLFGLWTGALGQTGQGVLLLPLWATPGVTVAETTEVPSVGVEPPRIVDPPEFRFPDFGRDREFPVPPTVAPPTFPQPEPVPFPEPTPMPSFRFDPPERFRPTPPTTDSPDTTDTTAAEESLGRTQLAVSAHGQGDDEGDESEPFEPFDEPPLAPAVVSVLFGLAYVLGAALLDSARLRRLAAPFHLVGLVALTTGTVLLGPRLGATTVGAAGVVFAAAVVALGVLVQRRFVAWYAAGALSVAVATLIGAVFADSAAAAGICLLVVGAAAVALGAAAATPPLPRTPSTE